MAKRLRSLIISILILVSILLVNSIAYAETKLTNLSMDQAVYMALSHSAKVRINQLQLKNYETNRDDTKSAVTYTPTNYLFEAQDTMLSGDPFASFLKAKYTYDKQEKLMADDIKRVAIDTISTYHKAIKSEQSVRAAELSLRKVELQLSQGTAKHRVGLISNLDLLGLKAQAENSRSNLEDAKKQIELSWAELNKQIGQSPQYRANLTESITFKSTNFAVEDKVALALTNSYEIWDADKSAELAKNLKIFEQYYNTGERNQRIAEISNQDAREQFVIQVQDLGLTIKALEVKYNYLDQKLKEQKEAVRVAEIQKKLGLVTADIPLNLQANMLQLENNLLEVASQHLIAVKNLERMTGEYQVYSK